MDLALLGVYLNDHAAGSAAGTSLIRRTARAHRGTAAGPRLAELAEQVAEDQQALLAMMSTLGIRTRHYKLVGAWVAERAGRAKLNGRILRRSPLSSLVELEGMKLGVEGKLAGWRTLRLVAERDSRLDAPRLDALITRAQEQAATLEELRIAAAGSAFTGG